MVKVLTFLKRKPGMPVGEFQEYWRAHHPAVVTRLPGIRRYVQSHVLPEVYATGEPVHDGIAEVWADDTDALRAMTRSAVHDDLVADEATFIDRSRMGMIVTDEHIVTEGAVAGDGVKAVEFLTRRPDLSADAFRQHWIGRHAPLAAAIPGVRRCVLSTTRAAAYAAGRVPVYDGAALIWFDSIDALQAAGGSAEYRAVVADRPDFLASAQPPFIVTREHVIIG